MLSKPTSQYRLRLTILPRVLAAQGPNGEEAESWPAPSSSYSAARESLNAGEQIAQGMAVSTGMQKLRIKGRAIAVRDVDRIKFEATGEVFNVTSVSREFSDTLLTVERVPQQTVPQ